MPAKDPGQLRGLLQKVRALQEAVFAEIRGAETSGRVRKEDRGDITGAMRELEGALVACGYRKASAAERKKAGEKLAATTDPVPGAEGEGENDG